jgi:hypothetical protein
MIKYMEPKTMVTRPIEKVKKWYLLSPLGSVASLNPVQMAHNSMKTVITFTRIPTIALQIVISLAASLFTYDIFVQKT